MVRPLGTAGLIAGRMSTAQPLTSLWSVVVYDWQLRHKQWNFDTQAPQLVPRRTFNTSRLLNLAKDLLTTLLGSSQLNGLDFTGPLLTPV